MTARRSPPLLAALCAALLTPAAAAKTSPNQRGSARAKEPAAPLLAEPPLPRSPRSEMSRETVKPASPAKSEPPSPAPRSPAPVASPAPKISQAPKNMAASPGPKRHVNDTTPPERRCSSLQSTAGAQHFERTRAGLREFSWSDMAHFFETSLDETEPQPTQVATQHTLTSTDAIRRSGLSRKPLEAVARAQALDLLSERELLRIHKIFNNAGPAAIRSLLRADSPALRAHVWTWLATTPSGTCILEQLDLAALDAAILDRSVTVEHGEDLVFRPLGDYALAARARLADANPQAFDQLLRALWADATLDPRVRALVAGLRVRRGHADSLEQGLHDPVAAVRGAVSAAAIERDRERYEARLIEHAASDPADLVTELIIGALLGGPEDPPRQALAKTHDPRLQAALARWRGRGDPMAPLPAPDQPLRFAGKRRTAPAHEPSDMTTGTSKTSTPPAPAIEAPAAAPPPAPAPAPAPPPLPRLPGVLDEPG